jgi:hypothetical protein
VELTDRIIPSLGFTRRGPGKPPEVTDAELVCLAVAQVLLRLVAGLPGSRRTSWRATGAACHQTQSW